MYKNNVIFLLLTSFSISQDNLNDSVTEQNKISFNLPSGVNINIAGEVEFEFVDVEGRLVDESGRYIDKEGNFVDRFGNIVDAEGEYVVDAEPFLDDDGKPLPAGELGAIVAKLPLPPGTFNTLWNAEDRFRKSYLDAFPGYYETGDAGYIDDDGYLYIMARTDDVINVAGHRLSTGGMEEVLASHPDVAECAVIGVSDQLKGQLPMGFVCLNADADRDAADVCKECVKLVREKIGPVAAFKLVTVVDRLPKTRSGKILRGTMVSIADAKPYKMPATIDDPAILDEIKVALGTLGYPAKT